MALSSPSLCQQEQCDAFQFTICRHCQLFLCIRHLAEHQQQFPSDFQRLLDDARRQQAQLSTLDVRSLDSRLKFNVTNADNDISQYRSSANSVVQSRSVPSIQTLTHISPSDKVVDNRYNSARILSTANFLSLTDKIQTPNNDSQGKHLFDTNNLDDETLFAAFGDPNSTLLTAPDLNSSDILTKISRLPNLNNKHDQSEISSLITCIQKKQTWSTSVSDSNFYTTSQTNSSNNVKMTGDETEDVIETEPNPTPTSLTVRELKTYKCDYCPLSTNTYGIEAHHQVRHIPCIRRSTSQISLFEHLKQYHYLNYAASMQIVRLVSSGDLEDHPTLFSSASQSSIVSILPSFFRAPCPLTQHHVFGLGPMHGIRLCSPSAEQQDFALYDHFLAYHQLNRASAMKLVKAMMNNENSSQRILFRPDEQVLNETAYVSCPLSNYEAKLPHQERIPHTPCQSTVKLRYLTGHLRDVHHLNKVAAKRISSALRHEQTANNNRSTGLFERDENILKAKKKKTANRFRPPSQLAKVVQQNHQQPPPAIW